MKKKDPIKASADVISFRGQGTTCKGRVTVTLTGPQGSGKSLIAKILEQTLPLTPVDEVVIVENNG